MAIPVNAWVPMFLADEARCQRLVELGKALLEAREYVAARCVLGRALCLEKRDRDTRHNAQIYHALGRVYGEQGRYIQALRWFNKLERATRHAPLSRMHGVAAYNVGWTLGSMHQPLPAVLKLDEAIELFERLHLDTELGSAWITKANILLTMRRYDQSLPAYRHAAHWLKGNPFWHDALLGVAITTLALQGPDAALPLLHTLTEDGDTRQSVRVKVLSYVAAALRWSGRYEEALGYAYQALRILLPDLQYGREDRSIPAGLVAGILTEETLCHMLKSDYLAARHTLDAYKLVKDDSDSYDIAVMNILAEVLGAEPVEADVPETVEDGHERRLAAALSLLQDFTLSNIEKT